MPVIYNVIIETTGKENHFQVTWQNPGNNTKDTFSWEAKITTEEIQWLWQIPSYQLIIGEKLFRFLDGEAHHFRQALNQANYMGEPLQVNLWTSKQTSDWPFELLAKDKTFLLSQQLHLVRRVSDWGKEIEILPQNRPLKLLFMACSALDVQPGLDFEREEEAIFRITENLAIDMEVEDSGSLEGLRSHLEREQYDVVYLSGHAGIDKNGSPYFIMEDEFGNMRQVFPDELWNECLIKNPPRLLFLSGCRTGETPDSDESTDAVSFAHLLVESYNVPAVLGWGRSVRDEQAIHAGKMLFHELSRGKTILEAVQRVRYELIKNFPSTDKPAWPLLRLFSSGMPLNAIVEKEQKWKPKVRIMDHIYLKNSQVKVLAEGFVGRRRQLQTSLRGLKKNFDKVGVLLLGTGGLGKSCLAGKICERFPDHTLIIVHGRFNAITMESAMTDAFISSQDKKGQQILSQKIEMTDKLPHLCSTSFKQKNYLLVLDDFEQNLEGSDKGQPGLLLPEAADLLKALLHYLPHSGKMTQLIITSRYDFSLSEYGRDLVKERLEKVWLTSFQETEQLKKAQELENILNYEDQSKVPNLLAAGHGNPRLMEWLNILVGQMAAAEVPQLVEAIKDKQEDFIHDHVIRELLQMGGDDLTCFLHWFSIYRRPVLVEGAAQVAQKANLSDWEELLRIGMGLSLVEYDQARQSYQATPLLREELLNGLEDIAVYHEAAFDYYKKVCETRNSIDPVLNEEWIYHALGCGKEDEASDKGSILVNYLSNSLAYQESRRIGEWILLRKKRECSTANDAFLLNALGCTMNDLGDHNRAIKYYHQALAIINGVYGVDSPFEACVLNNLGEACRYLGEPKKTIDYYQQALSINNMVYGDGHYKVANTLNNLGALWDDLGDYHQATKYYMQALNILKNIYGKMHPQVANTLNNMGLTWAVLGEYKKAIDYHEQALAICQSVYGENHPSVAINLASLGSAWYFLGDYHKAISYFELSLTIWRNVYGDKHPNVARDLNNLGNACNSLGEYNKATDYFQKALVILEKVHGEGHPNVAKALNNLGSVFHNLGEFNKAIDYYKQALSIDSSVYGGDHSDLAIDFNNIGLAYFQLGETDQAKGYFEKAFEIFNKTNGPEHPTTKNVIEWLKECISEEK